MPLYGNRNTLYIDEYNDGGICSYNAIDSAIMNGHLEIIKFLYKYKLVRVRNDQSLGERYYISDAKINFNAIDYAAEKGYLEVVKWLYKNSKERCTANGIYRAANNGHIEVVKFLFDYDRYFFSNEYLDDLKTKYQYEIANWLIDNCKIKVSGGLFNKSKKNKKITYYL